jgi:RNA polymerase sigma factor (sigma-70 family)
MSQYSTFVVDRHIEEHENLVHWVVHRQWLGPLPYLDAVQAGRIGLWRALRRYDPERGHAFSTYAVPAIQRAVWRAVVESQPPAHISLSRSGWLALPNSPLDPTEALDEVERLSVCDSLYDLVCELPCRLAYVIVARYGLTGDPPQPWRVIAEGLRVTRQRVQQLHTEAILWLAHPAYSLQLRQLVGRNTVTDYQAYHARLRTWQRASRRKR